MITKDSNIYKDLDQILVTKEEIAARIRADRPNVELTALKPAEDGRGLIARFRETEGRETEAAVVQSLVKNAKIERVTVLEEPCRGRATDNVALRPFETVTLRLTGDMPSIRMSGAKEPWTGLLTRPRVFPGGKGGKTYLLWGTDGAPDFDHYEIERDGRPLANVTNIVDEGVLYRNARYEDGEAEFGRHVYRVRSVYKDGRAGAWTEFAPLSHTGGADESAVVEHGDFKARCMGAHVWSWRPQMANGDEILFMQQNPHWGEEVQAEYRSGL